MTAPQFNVLLRSEQSDGQVAVIENVVPAGWSGTPLHHHDFDEAWYIVEGTLTSSSATTSSPPSPGR